MHRVWLGLGTNVGDRARNLAGALHGIAGFTSVDAVSGVYETQPFGYVDQPVFWNMVARARTELDAPALLRHVKDLERRLGRVATFPMGPRAIDIDVLLYDDDCIESAELTLPHPGVASRPFVLVPLLELDAALVDPRSGRRLADSAAATDRSGLRLLGAAAAVLGVQEWSGH